MIPNRSFLLLALGALLLLPAASRAQGPCRDPLPLLAGSEDDFAGGYEDPSPSEALLAYAKSSWPQRIDRRFDENLHDTALIHTFSGWGGDVCGATLTLKVRATINTLSSNDSFRLGLIGGSDPQMAFRYWATFRLVLGDWGPKAEGTVVVDLARMPDRPPWDTDILDELEDGELELLVEDDTDIDYARLDVCLCDGTTVPVEATTWGALKTRYAGDR